MAKNVLQHIMSNMQKKVDLGRLVLGIKSISILIVSLLKQDTVRTFDFENYIIKHNFNGLGDVISKEHQQIIKAAIDYRYEKLLNGGIIL